MQDKRPFDIYDKIWMLSHIKYESEVHPKQQSDLVIDYNDESKPVLYGNENPCLRNKIPGNRNGNGSTHSNGTGIQGWKPGNY